MTNQPTAPPPPGVEDASHAKTSWSEDNGPEIVTGEAPQPPPGKTSSRGVIITVVIAVVAVLALGAGSLYMVSEARQEAAAARADANAAVTTLDREREEADAAATAAEAAADMVASEEAAAEEAAEAAAQSAANDERRRRELAVNDIEDSIAVLAAEHVADGLIDGPVLDVSCSPVAGGSLDDLTDVTTAFDCFVTNEELDDGRARGFTYNATMNWDSGEYTYGIGSS